MKAPVSFDNFPTFAANGSRDMNPESAKYSVGFVPADTFPAEWANYMFHGATKGVSDLNTAVASIWAENANVLTQAGITPAAENNGQLYSAIMKFINDAVLTANQQVLAQAKLDAHPVGSLYWSSSPTDPATLFGGTWTRIKDRFVLAAGDTYGNGATGGSATVQLTESNLPAHSHSFTPSGSISITTNPTFTGSAVNTDEKGGHSHVTNGTSNSAGTAGKTLTGTVRINDNIGVINKNSGAVTGIFSTSTERNVGVYGNNKIHSYDLYMDATHSHPTNTAGAHTHSVTASGTISGGAYKFTGSAGTTGNKGDGGAHNNMPPYIVKFCWERVS